MKTKYFAGLLSLFFCLSGISFSQKIDPFDAPNLSGTWSLTKRDSGNSFLGGLSDKAFVGCSAILVIEQREPEIKLKFTSMCPDTEIKRQINTEKSESLYYTDKRGETNPFHSGATVSSLTYWKDNVLQIDEYSTSLDPVGKVRKKPFNKITFKLSKDGNILTKVINDSGGGAINSLPVKMTQEFRRKS